MNFINLRKHQIIVFYFILLISGCAIIPQTADIPLIKEKGDLRIDAGVSMIPSANATITYGLTEKVSIQTFGSYGADYPYYLQGAVGLFKNRGNNWITEWYAGAGTGISNVSNNADSGKLNGNYHLYFSQFNFGKVNNNFLNADYGMSLKTGYLRTSFRDRNYFDTYSKDDNWDTYAFPIQKDNSVLMQPMAFVRLGNGNLKFNLKLSGLFMYQFTNRDNKIPYGYYNIGLGLNYYFNTRSIKNIRE
jgi:hypothetical protein